MRKLVAVAALGALVLAACGGGGKSTSNGASNVGGSSKGGNDFSSLVAKANAAKYKVTYQSGTDKPFTVAQDPPKFSYTSGDSATYVLADGSAVACSGTGATATCTSMPGGDSIKQGLSSTFGAIGALFLSAAGKGIPGLTNITKTSNTKVAGRDAVCATISAGTLGALGAALGAAIGSGSYSVCIDRATGVMLSSKSDDGKGQVSEITATDFSTPSDADFTPPATPQTIPSIPNLSIPSFTIPSTPTT